MVDMKEYLLAKINGYQPKLYLHKQHSNDTMFIISFDNCREVASCISVGGLGGIPNTNAIKDALDVRFSNAVYGLKEATAGVEVDNVCLPER